MPDSETSNTLLSRFLIVGEGFAFNRHCAGIDKLTYRHGLALQDRGLNAQYIDASSHFEVSFKSKHARKTQILVTELVNLSIP